MQKHLPIFDVVGKEIATAWAAAGAERLERHGWWILKGNGFTSCGVYKHMYPNLYASSSTVYELPDVETT